MDNDDNILEILQCFWDTSKECLDEDSAKTIQHYLDHDEYEMAFELLILVLADLRKYPPNFVFEPWIELAKNLNLNTESVYAPDFWERFMRWGKHDEQ